MSRKFHYVFLFFLLFAPFFGCIQQKTTPEQTKDPTDAKNLTSIAPGTLPELMQPDSRLMPLISAHRGGRNIAAYPENSIEVFQYTLSQTPAMMECDVNISKDGQLLLMHDNALDRTTTGTGKVQEKEWSYIKGLKLVDDFGKETNFKVPTFTEALKWANGKAILSVDIKRGVPFEKVVEEIEAEQMEDYVVVITYSVGAAQRIHELNDQLMISVSIRNQEEWQRMKDSGVPYDRMVAFTGTRLSPKALFDTLHAYQIPAILGTLGNLDKQAEARGDDLYHKWLDLGADILATDRPEAVGALLAR